MPTPFLTRKRLLLAKSESTYGTSAAPAASDAVLVDKPEVDPLQLELKEREIITGNLGNRDSVVARRMVMLKFGVELASSGTPGTPPRWGPILKACGFSETIATGQSVTYAPVSSGYSSCTFDFFNDGQRQLIVGARGTVSIDMKSDDIPMLNFEMQGIYASPTTLANPTPAYTNQAAPLAVNADNTTAVSVHGYSGCMAAFSLQVANNIVFRQLAGCTKQVMITDRKPKSEITIELPALGDKDFFTLASNQAKGVIGWQHKDASNGTITYLASTCAFDSPTYEDADGIQHIKLPNRPIPTTAGNDEFSLVLA